MKKITLSAAILALAMMGCSDTGVDNSVASASTNEVKIVETKPSLARIVASPENIEIEHLTPGNNGYRFYPYEKYGIGVEMATVVDLDWDGYEGQSAYHVLDAPYNPNIIHVVTTLVADCIFKFYPYTLCKTERTGSAHVPNTDVALVQTPRDGLGQKVAHDMDGAKIGAVSAFVAIWNQGTPVEIVLKAATYSGGLFQGNDGLKKAQAVYDTYIKGEVCNILGTSLC